MRSLATEIQYLKGVGPNLARGLHKVGIFSVGDILYYLPRRYEDRRRWEVAPEIRYGFANERVGAKVAAEYTYEPKKFSTIAAEGGSFVAQFNGNNPITPFIN